MKKFSLFYLNMRLSQGGMMMPNVHDASYEMLATMTRRKSDTGKGCTWESLFKLYKIEISIFEKWYDIMKDLVINVKQEPIWKSKWRGGF